MEWQWQQHMPPCCERSCCSWQSAWLCSYYKDRTPCSWQAHCADGSSHAGYQQEMRAVVFMSTLDCASKLSSAAKAERDQVHVKSFWTAVAESQIGCG